MKVKKALEILGEIDPEDNICFMWFERHEFDDWATDPEAGVPKPIWDAAVANWASTVDENELKEILEIEICRLLQLEKKNGKK
jgi:hypothetical protein